MKNPRLFFFLAGLTLSGCQIFNDPVQESPATFTSQAGFESLQYNPKWYRTYDSTSSGEVADGGLLFAWSYGDSARHPDSFYVGIDTLWSLPLNLGGDTSASGSWDLQMCPDGFCVHGLRAGVHGANAPIHFGDTGEYAPPYHTADTGQYDYTTFQTEHYFEFWPAVSAAGHPRAPDGSLFGALMFVRSRTTLRADTVFAFGAWKLAWDTAFPPPIRPVAGYRPKKSDFVIVGNSVRYTGP